jgi:large subunit ribosomal protein L5
MASRLNDLYKTEVKKKMMDKYSYSNVHQIPKLEKIVINSVTRDAVTNGKVVESVISDLAAITGQKPVISRAKKSVASFKVREGQALGACVTLRGERMYEFLDRFISFTLPRVKDFRGLSPKAFDGKGNYNLGMKEQIVFPEINYDKIDKVRGMAITFVTTAENNDEGRELLRFFGMPFREK